MMSMRPAWVRVGLARVSGAHETMAALVAKHGEPRYLTKASEPPFVALCKIVVGQQLAGAAARSIWKRTLVALGVAPCDDAVCPLTPACVLAKCDDEVLGEPTRAAAGLSRAKARAIVGIANSFHVGRLSPEMMTTTTTGGASLTPAALRDLLLSHVGIGPWSVDMYMLFHLKFPDVLPLGDLAVRAGALRAFGRRGSLKNGALCPKKDQALLEELFEPFRPYRSLAAFYMWRVLDAKSPFDDDNN